jgi:hypothetical protein
MSLANPYERFLDGRPVELILAATPKALTEALARIGDEKIAVSPAPGKWSAAQILCHLADCEMVFGFRLRQTLAEDVYTIQQFDQDKWAGTYSGVAAAQAFEVFCALRAWNLRLIEAALPAAASRPVHHPKRGPLTFQILVEIIAGHDLNHLDQLKRLGTR